MQLHLSELGRFMNDILFYFITFCHGFKAVSYTRCLKENGKKRCIYRATLIVAVFINMLRAANGWTR